MADIIIAYGEYFQGRLHPASLEILTPLYEIAEKMKKRLVLLILSKDKEEIKNSPDLKKALCHEVWIVESSEFTGFKDDLYSRVVTEVVREKNSYGVFFPSTFQGLSLAPRIAGLLGVGLCAHVNAFELGEDKLLMLRPTYGENIMAKLYSTTLPIMATIALGAFPIREALQEPEFKEIRLSADFNWKSKIRLRKFISSKKEPNRLSVAKVVLAGGLGLKKRENFEKLQDLAKHLEAEVGVTRPLCYAGWMDEEHMIGVSGVTVRPKLYIGFGISGAIQHTSGMENSEFIIAVNTDKEAPLVKMAHLSLICDAGALLDALLKRLRV
ncbi:electron transfer flavoprotein alpha subunit [Caldimicrobium thiodismutans]|jgi:electron transfer flavoprotein alpha subunit|uniref:Electron transfer flavoprotein alpha subunit n=1 Tax=Caldimicrobium thiodismutans TaxID=1653476 RepID=A0A0U4W103_9BACT|nr:electron transfer flavoprotein subunit alpha/FixB family protein [Caldimicrobium thiodismutans]BAU22842.1 electron transfer flavoprotein alpha subunit [Caldimicrobium thiodismutans]